MLLSTTAWVSVLSVGDSMHEVRRQRIHGHQFAALVGRGRRCWRRAVKSVMECWWRAWAGWWFSPAPDQSGPCAQHHDDNTVAAADVAVEYCSVKSVSWCLAKRTHRAGTMPSPFLRALRQSTSEPKQWLPSINMLLRLYGPTVTINEQRGWFFCF